MTDEIGTLQELNVKPGDVVLYVGEFQNSENAPRTISAIINDKFYHSGQKTGSYISMSPNGPWKIISRAKPPVDLTALTTPFGLLDEVYGPDTAQRLRDHGGPYEWFDGWRWQATHWNAVEEFNAVRVAPAPKVETVTLYGHVEYGIWVWGKQSYDDTHRLTFTTTNGVPDGPATIEALK